MTASPPIQIPSVSSAVKNSAALQRRLPLSVPIIAPLKTIDALRSDLQTDEDEIMYLIGDRQFLAFNIAAKNSDRAEVRIFPPTPNQLTALRGEGGARLLTSRLDLDQAINQIISTQRQHLPATMLRNRLVCSSKHIHTLIAEKLLTAVPGTGDAINQTPMILRPSVVAFLKARQL